MIKLDIDIVNEKFALEHDMFCKEQVIDEITKVLDTIIVDYEIKTRPSTNNLSEKEKEQLLIVKRREYLALMKNIPCSCMEYFSQPKTYIRNE